MKGPLGGLRLPRPPCAPALLCLGLVLTGLPQDLGGQDPPGRQRLAGPVAGGTSRRGPCGPLHTATWWFLCGSATGRLRPPPGRWLCSAAHSPKGDKGQCLRGTQGRPQTDGSRTDSRTRLHGAEQQRKRERGGPPRPVCSCPQVRTRSSLSQPVTLPRPLAAPFLLSLPPPDGETESERAGPGVRAPSVQGQRSAWSWDWGPVCVWGLRPA